MRSASPTASTPTQTTTSPLPEPSAHVVLFLIDGVGDVPCRAFERDRRGGNGGGSERRDDLTPLQAAAPLDALDAVASRGLVGLLDPVEPGKACGSDTAHLSLLGYDPRTYYRGRGAFESLGAGLSMEPGDIAFKCNFATVEEGESETPLVVSRRADRSFEEEGPALCSSLDGIGLPSFPNVCVRVKYATEHRAGVVVSVNKKREEEAQGKSSRPEVGRERPRRRLPPPPFELSDAVSGTDPLKDNLPLLRCRPLLGDEERDESEVDDARVTSRIVNELSDEIRRVLSSHPVNDERRRRGKPVANALLLRGCGARAPLPDFCRTFGFGAALAVAPTKIIAGLASCAGFRVLEVPKATGDYRTSLRSKAEAVARAIEEEEERREGGRGEKPPPSFVLLHLKAVDDAGHDRAPFKKVSWLRAADEAVAVLARRLGGARGGVGPSPPPPGPTRRPVVLAVTGDHSTPVEYGDHSCEPVPFAVAPLDAVARALSSWETGPDDGGEIVAASEEETRSRVFDSPFSVSAKSDDKTTFDETSASRGSLGRFPGSEVMPLLVRLSAAL